VSCSTALCHVSYPCPLHTLQGNQKDVLMTNNYNDDEYHTFLTKKQKPDWQYHEVCLWLPHKPETVEDIANDMVANGFRLDRAIATYEGKILDGRHRYEAALKAGAEPIFVEFQGTKEEAIAYVTSENVARRHLNTKEKEFFYVQRADALGVRERKDNQHTPNGASSPSQEDHANALGVGHRTVSRWEKDRKEIKYNPELAAKANTPQGYREAKKEVQKRRAATKEEARKIASLKSLGESSEVEADNVERKLAKFRAAGVDVDAVESPEDKQRAQNEYRLKWGPRKVVAYEMAALLVDNKDYSLVAAVLSAAYPKEGELEHAYNIALGDTQ
jgi:transcriptional regulator with XRE-family HTH domain